MHHFSRLFIASFLTLIVSATDEAQWVKTSLGDVSVLSIGISDTNIFAGTATDGIFLSTDAGASWNAVNIGIPTYPHDTVYAQVRSLTPFGKVMFAGTTAGLVRSTNKGATWETFGQSIPNVYGMAISDSYFFAGTWGGGIFRSRINDSNWTNVINVTRYNYVTSIFAFGASVLAGTAEAGGGKIILSTNSGSNWTEVSNGGSNGFALIDTCLIAANGWLGVLRSTSNGSTWANTIGMGFIPSFIYSMTSFGQNLFVASADGVVDYVFMSTNEGASWTEVDASLPANVNISRLAIKDSILYAGSNGQGVWKRRVSEMVTQMYSDSPNLTSPFELFQNYPNPFNPITKISYTVPRAGFVSLIIYDMAGREAKRLIYENKPPGDYSITFDAIGIPSGVYFYKLISNGIAKTRKMLLIR